ncbi:MAG: CcdB family protein [Sulfuricurvum sp.]
MAQFDVYRNINPLSLEEIPYLLDIQADLLAGLSTRVVVPLARHSTNIQHLNPLFEISGEKIVMLTQELSGVDKNILGEKVGSFGNYRREIIASLDFLISGF